MGLVNRMVIMRLLAPLLLMLAMLPQSGRAAELVMVEEPGCMWCARWNSEIAHIYPKTSEGRFAPLIRMDKSDQVTDAISFARKVVYTPTFVLIENGRELGRIEGYPGEDFFWGLLGEIIEKLDSTGESNESHGGA